MHIYHLIYMSPSEWGNFFRADRRRRRLKMKFESSKRCQLTSCAFRSFFQSNFLVCVCWMEHIYIYTYELLHIYIYTHYICNILSMLFFCCSDQLVHRKINPQRPIIQSFGGCRCHCGARLQRRPPRRSLLRIIQWLVGQCTWSSCSVIFDT